MKSAVFNDLFKSLHLNCRYSGWAGLPCEENSASCFVLSTRLQVCQAGCYTHSNVVLVRTSGILVSTTKRKSCPDCNVIAGNLDSAGRV